MSFSPMLFLAGVLGVTAAAWAWELAARAGRRHRVQAIAGKWQMHYSEGDRFHLAPRVAEQFPVYGAADVRVADVVYGVRGARHYYIFTAEFTEGVVRTKHRRWRVAALSEGRGQAAEGPGIKITLAPEGMGLVEQYEHLAQLEAEQKIAQE